MSVKLAIYCPGCLAFAMRVAYYHTVCADNFKDLDHNVNKLISEQWQPYGNPYVCVSPPESSNGEKCVICQALVMEGDTASFVGRPYLEHTTAKRP